MKGHWAPSSSEISVTLICVVVSLRSLLASFISHLTVYVLHSRFKLRVHVLLREDACISDKDESTIIIMIYSSGGVSMLSVCILLLFLKYMYSVYVIVVYTSPVRILAKSEKKKQQIISQNLACISYIYVHVFGPYEEQEKGHFQIMKMCTCTCTCIYDQIEAAELVGEWKAESQIQRWICGRGLPAYVYVVLFSAWFN